MSTENDIYIFQIRPDGIVHVHYKMGANVTIEILKELEALYNAKVKTESPFIFSGDEFVSFTNEARKYAVIMDRRSPIQSSTVVARNLAQKILAQYYFKFVKTYKPIHMVNTLEEGLALIYEKYEPKVID
jgi:uncharacterized protein YydD (DUF2326 family)